MSRTDKTDPAWVKMRQPEWRHLIREYHRCYDGGCDIEDYDPRWGFTRPYLRGQKCWTTWWSWKSFCSCSSCSWRSSYFQRCYHKRVRAAWRQERQMLLKGSDEYKHRRIHKN